MDSRAIRVKLDACSDLGPSGSWADGRNRQVHSVCRGAVVGTGDGEGSRYADNHREIRMVLRGEATCLWGSTLSMMSVYDGWGHIEGAWESRRGLVCARVLGAARSSGARARR